MSASEDPDRSNPRDIDARMLLDTWSEVLEESLERWEVHYPATGMTVPSWTVWLASSSLTRRTSGEYIDQLLSTRLRSAAERLRHELSLDRATRRVEYMRSLAALEQGATKRAEPMLEAYRSARSSPDRGPRAKAAGDLLGLADLFDLVLLASCEISYWPEKPTGTEHAADAAASGGFSLRRVASTARWLAACAPEVPELLSWYSAHRAMLSPTAAVFAHNALSERVAASTDRAGSSAATSPETALGLAASAIIAAESRIEADRDDELLELESIDLAKTALRLVAPEAEFRPSMAVAESAAGTLDQLLERPLSFTKELQANPSLWEEPGVAAFALLANAMRPQLAAAAAGGVTLPSPGFRWDAPDGSGFATWTAWLRPSGDAIKLEFFDSAGARTNRWQGKSVRWFGKRSTLESDSMQRRVSELVGNLPLVRIIDEAVDLEVDGEPWVFLPPTAAAESERDDAP